MRTLTHQLARRRWLIYVAIGVSVLTLTIWYVFYANQPARQVGQLHITPPSTSPVTITLWVAEPRVDLPFTTDTAWVRCGRNEWKLYSRAFGHSTGSIAVAPDRTRAVAYGWFQGHEFPGVVIDLRTGAMQRADRWVDYEAHGWTMHRWQ
jgi:hypothetical protein